MPKDKKCECGNPECDNQTSAKKTLIAIERVRPAIQWATTGSLLVASFLPYSRWLPLLPMMGMSLLLWLGYRWERASKRLLLSLDELLKMAESIVDAHEKRDEANPKIGMLAVHGDLPDDIPPAVRRMLQGVMKSAPAGTEVTVVKHVIKQDPEKKGPVN